MKKTALGKCSSNDSTLNHTHHPGISYRIGDLLWCQEARNNKLWWPAMVTYDPKQGIFFRIIKQKIVQYHVQYFGISAIRGWVTGKSCVAFIDVGDKEFDLRALSKKTRAEYEVAMQEVSEAKLLNHKQRKLKYIFSFGPPQKDKKPVEDTPADRLPEKVKKESLACQQIMGKSDKPQNFVQNDGKQNSKRKSLPGCESSLDVATSGKRRSSSTDKNSAVQKSKGRSFNEVKSKPEAEKLKKEDMAAKVVSFPRFHDQHSNKNPLETEASTGSNFPDCDQCMDYICSSDCVELTCPSEVETVQPLDLEGSSKSIVMFVQKEFERKHKSTPDCISSPILLPVPGAALTKGTPTMNAVTEIPSSVSGVDSGLYENGHSERESMFLSDLAKLPQSSESSCKSAKNNLVMATAGVKRRRKGSIHHSPGLVSSNLLVTQSPSGNAMESEEPVTQLSRHSTALASGKDSLTSEDLSPALVEKKLHPRRRHSEQGGAGALLSRRSSRLLSASTPVSNGSGPDSAVMSVTDSGSESGLTPMVLTPTASSPSLAEVDANKSDAAVLLPPVSKPVKKRSRPSAQPPSEVVNLCSLCECEDTDLLVCKGYCFNSFHLDCLGLVERPKFDFICDECIFSSGSCFVCTKAEGQLYQCSKSKCSKLYHLDCIKDNKLFQISKGNNFVCALHVCAKCTSIGGPPNPSRSLLQCTKCPLALHYPDCLVAGSQIIDNTHMTCYQHIKINVNSALYRHINLNTCLECGDIGSLFCCDMCSAAYHLECLDEDARPIGDSSFWKCPNCAVHDLPTYNSLVVTKFGRWRWWPSQVVAPDDIPDNILSKNPGDCMFVVRFCASREFCWTYHGRVIPYTEEVDSVEGQRKKIKSTMDKYQQACKEASEIFKVKCLEQAKQAEVKQNSKVYHKIKTNKYLVPRPPPDQDELDFFPCQCTKENPCKEESTCVNRASHIECTPNSCTVGELCQNQRMQKFQNAKTETFYTGSRGWGLKASTNLSKGDFVIEYVGEILDEDMCRERITKAHEENIDNFYMLTLDAGLVIDAESKSNHARFINHSCSPNCETQKWRVRGEPRIGIFASTEIEAGTELTFDYQLDSLGNEKKKCRCGSKNCSGFLGERKVKVVSSEDERKTKVKVKKKKPKPKARQPLKEEEVEEDRHDDACFICRDGGKLLLCDRKLCTRAYHLQCLNRKLTPPSYQKWDCPWHFCSKCQKPSVTACSMCPESYCAKHSADKLFKPVHSKFKIDNDATVNTFDDDGVTVSMQNMLLCESCLQETSNDRKLPVELLGRDGEDATRTSKEALDKECMSGDLVHNADTLSSSEASTGEKQLETKSRPKRLHKESVGENKEDIPQNNISSEVFAKNEQGKDVQPRNQEHHQQSIPHAVITTQQPSKKKKLREAGHVVSPHLSPQDLHRSPLESCRVPPSSSTNNTVSNAVESHDEDNKPLAVSDKQKLSPEPTVDVDYSPLSRPPIGREQQRATRSGLEELLQQNNPLPSLKDQQDLEQPNQQQQQQNQQPNQQQQSHQHQNQPHISQHEQLGYNVYLQRNPESQIFRPNDPDNTHKSIAPIFQPAHGNISGQVTSPAIASGNPGYPSPGGFMGAAAAAAGLVRPPAFQQHQQPQPFNPVWFLPNRNGFMNGLEPTGGFGYPPYPPAFLTPNPIGLSYPYFPDASMSTFDTFSGNAGSHHPQMTPSSVPTSSLPPTSTVFPSVLPSGPQNLFTWNK